MKPFKEEVVLSDNSNVFKSEPMPNSMVNHDIQHKGHLKGVCISQQYIVTTSQHVRIWLVTSGENITTVTLPPDTKLHCLNYTPSEETIWLGINNGEILEIGVPSGTILSRSNTHSSPVCHILQGIDSMYSIDDNGGLRIWNGPVSLDVRPSALRVQSKPTLALLMDDHLTTSTGKTLQVYALNPFVEIRVDSLPSVVSCLAYDRVKMELYVGYESGKVAVYSTLTFERLMVVQVAPYRVTAMCIVAGRIWIGLFTGKILVFEGLETQILDFVCYVSVPVVSLSVDVKGMVNDTLSVMSVSEGGHIKVWDGLLTAYRVDKLMRKKVDEYSLYKEIEVVILTYNIDSRKPVELERGVFEDFIRDNEGDVYVFGFQELVDLENKGVNAKTFLVGSSRDSKLDERMNLWKERLIRLFPPSYSLVKATQLVGLFQCIIAKNSVLMKDLAISQTKTGLGGLYGNKGAISTRFSISDSTFCFVNAHLAAHQSHTSERNKDISQILKDTTFPKVGKDHHWEGAGDGSMILDHEHLFFSGDLNYRIDMERQVVLDAILLKNYDQLLVLGLLIM